MTKWSQPACASRRNAQNDHSSVGAVAASRSDTRMIGLVLVTHGCLATEFRAALEHVVGPQRQVRTVAIGPEDDMEARRRDIALHSVRPTDESLESVFAYLVAS